MPAYVTHTLFSHIALLALVEAKHPLAGVAQGHAAMFRVAGIAGCDIQCMPYQICKECDAPYRHNQLQKRTCLVCGKQALEDFSFAVGDGRWLTRVDVERDYYRNTHLVLGRAAGGHGVDPKAPTGIPEQPFPEQVVRHLANMFRDSSKIGGQSRENFLAFTLGWFSHVVSDALFKGVYPQSVQVKFFGHQYNMAMLPAAEALTMTDISYDFGVHWPSWREELLNDERDGGALRHLAMGNDTSAYDPAYWTAEFGKPDPALGRVMDAVRPLNRLWFYRMYFTPDYSVPSPRLDGRKVEERADWIFRGRDMGQVRAYAIGSGWYETFIKGIDIYLRIVTEAAQMAKVPEFGAPGPTDGSMNWELWRRIVHDATGRKDRAADWGSKLEIQPEALRVLRQLKGRGVKLVMPEPATDYQNEMATALQKTWRLQIRKDADVTVMVGPRAFNSHAANLLCREDMLRLKYDSGAAGLVKLNRDARVLHIAGLSDFGDRKLSEWIRNSPTKF